jgi:hypothetical protein
MKYYNGGVQVANHDVSVEVLTLQEDALALLAPLSSAKIAELANGEAPHPPLPHMVYTCVEQTSTP